MAAPLILAQTALAAVVETTPGTAEAIVDADSAFNIYNLSCSIVADFEQRTGQGSMSQLAGVPGAEGGRMTFITDLYGGDSAPIWMSTLLLGCGASLSTLTATPETLPPEAVGSGAKTLTLGANQGGRLKKLYGAMGTARFVFPAGRRCFVEWEFTGVWADPADVSLPSPTRPTTAPLRMANSAFTVGGVSPLIEQLTFDLGNQVVLRESANDTAATGYHSALVVDRRPTVVINPEAQLVANWNPHLIMLARTEVAMSWALGIAGNKLTFSAPKAQIVSIEDGDRNRRYIDNITYQLNKSSDAGDDEWSIVSA